MGVTDQKVLDCRPAPTFKERRSVKPSQGYNRGLNEIKKLHVLHLLPDFCSRGVVHLSVCNGAVRPSEIPQLPERNAG